MVYIFLDCLLLDIYIYLVFCWFFSLRQLSLLFAAFWSKNLPFACPLGFWLLAFGFWLWPLAFGFCPLAFGFWPLAFGFWPLASLGFFFWFWLHVAFVPYSHFC